MSKAEIQKKSRANILIVDDELIVAMDMKHSLEIAGYQVAAIAVSAKDAMSKTEKEKPDIILMDIILKGAIDGIDTAKTILESYDVPIIFITASSDPQTFERAKLVGHYGYLIKPFDHRDLVNGIEMALYKHEMEKKVRKSEEHFRLLFEKAPVAFQSIDKNGILLDVNLAWEKMLGFSKREVIGTFLGDYITSKSKQKFPEVFEKFRSTGSLIAYEYDMICKDGSVITISATGTINYNELGEVDHTQCILYNITEKKKSERLIQIAEERYKAIIGTAIDGFVVIDIEGKFKEVNDALCKMLGYEEEELLKMGLPDIEYEETPEETKKHIQKIIKNGYDRFESRHARKNGEIINVEVNTIYLPATNNFLAFFNNITDEKKAEEISHRNLERLSALTESIAQGILFENERRIIAFANQTFCQYFGIPNPEMLKGFDCAAASEMSKSLFANPDEFISGINRAITEKHVVYNEILYLVDGRIFERDYIPININGKTTGNYWIYRDVTEQKNAERILTKTEEQLRYAIDASTDGIWDWNYESGELTWNNRSYEMFGYAINEFPLSFEKWYELVHPDDRELTWKAIQSQINEANGRCSVEYRIECKDGSYKWIIEKGKPVEINHDGSYKRIVGTHTDITKRKNAEIALLESENKYRTVTENVFDLITLINLDGNYEYCNNSYETTLGYKPEELIGKDSFSLVDPSELDKVTHHRNQLFKTADPQEITLNIVCKDGNIKKIFHRVKLLTDEKNNPYKIFIIAQDVTEKLLSEEKLKKQVDLLNKLSENIPGAIFQYQNYLNERSVLHFASKNIYNIYEVRPEEIKEDASIILKRIHKDDVNRVITSIKESAENLTIWECNYRVLLPSKGIRWISGISRPERMADGSTLWYGFVSDITERIKFEDSLNLEAMRNRIFMDSALDGILIINQEHRVIDVNRHYCEMSGYTKAELLKMYTWDYEARMSEEEICKNFANLEKISVKFETIHKRKDGSIFDVEVSANGALINDEAYIFTIVRDITESKKATDLLKQNQLMLLESQKTARIGYYYFDIVNDKWTSSDMLNDIFGITPEYSKSFNSWLLLIHPNDHDIINSYFSELLKRRKKQFNKEYRVVAKNNGAVKWVHGLGVLEYDEDGNLLRMTGAIQDITDRKVKEEKIIKQNTKLSSLFEISKNVSSTLDVKSILQSTTDSICGISAFDSSAIYILERDSIILQAATPPLPKDFPDFFRKAELKNHPHIKNAMFEAKTIIIADTLTAELTEEERVVCEQRNLRSILYLPLHTSEGILGCLIATSNLLYDITKDDVEICETIANLSALALEKARLYEFSQKNIIDLEYQIGERVRIEGELKEQLEEINRFNLLMVGRENKMIELKKEINELLIKIGLQPKYRIDDN
jgi:PAS domain S-box-containing protein